MNTNSDPWDACPAGEISRLADRLRGQRRRQMQARQATVAATLAIFVICFSAIGYFRQPAMPNQSAGGITCREIQEMMPIQMANLDEQTSNKLAAHLRECRYCRKKYGHLLQELNQPAGQANTNPLDRRVALLAPSW